MCPRSAALKCRRWPGPGRAVGRRLDRVGPVEALPPSPQVAVGSIAISLTFTARGSFDHDEDRLRPRLR